MDQGKVKNVLEKINILGTLRTFLIHGLVKMARWTEAWKLIPTLTGDFEGVKTSVEEGTSDVVEIARNSN